MEASNASHLFVPIDAQQEVRILELYAGGSDTALRGNILNVGRSTDVAERQTYEAISYTWGDPNDTERFFCDDGHIEIPRNLYIALQHLRSPDQSRFIWADSICINQVDALEKSQHVGRMYEVYQRASNVIMWIGPEDDHTRDSLPALQRLLQLVTEGSNTHDGRAILSLCQNVANGSVVLGKDVDVQNDETVNWGAIAAMLARPYFSRLWVLQEAVAAAERGTLQLGHQQMDWNHARNVGGHMKKLHYNLRHIIGAANPLPRVRRNMRNFLLLASGIRINQAAKNGPGQQIVTKLLSVLLMTTTFECSDPRDELFAILHLVPRTNLDFASMEHLLAPDYTRPKDEIFHRLAIYLLVESGDYNYLIFARAEPWQALNVVETSNHVRNEGSEQSLDDWKAPSWVPMRLTWNLRVPYYFYFHANTGGSVVRGSMAGGNRDHVHQQMHLSPDRRTLTLLGRQIDTIRQISTLSNAEFENQPEESFINSSDEFSPFDVNAFNFLRDCFREIWKSDWERVLVSTDFQSLVQWITIHNTFMGQDAPFEVPDADKLPALCQNYPYYLINGLAATMYDDRWMQLDLDERGLKYWFTTISRHILHGLTTHKLCQTRAGKLALVPRYAAENDHVWVINGVCVPMLIRTTTEQSNIVISECFLAGVMQGEALNMDDKVVEQLSLS